MNMMATPTTTATSQSTPEKWTVPPSATRAVRRPGRTTSAPRPTATSWAANATTGTSIMPGSSLTMAKPMPTRRKARPTLPPDDPPVIGGVIEGPVVASAPVQGGVVRASTGGTSIGGANDGAQLANESGPTGSDFGVGGVAVNPYSGSGGTGAGGTRPGCSSGAYHRPSDAIHQPGPRDVSLIVPPFSRTARYPALHCTAGPLPSAMIALVRTMNR